LPQKKTAAESWPQPTWERARIALGVDPPVRLLAALRALR
jgi:hypothetical protein